MIVEVAVLGSPSPNKPYGLCGRKATLNLLRQNSGAESGRRRKFYMAPIRFLSCLCLYGVHFLN